MGGTVLETTFYYENYIVPGDKKVSIVEPEAADYPGFIAEQVKTGKIGIDEVEGFFDESNTSIIRKKAGLIDFFDKNLENKIR